MRIAKIQQLISTLMLANSFAQNAPAPFLTLQQFDQIADTEATTEFDLGAGAELAEYYWSKSVLFEWTRAFQEEEKYENQNETKGGVGNYPFILCHANRRLSGIQRRNDILRAANSINAVLTRLYTFYNEDDMSCFQTKMLASKARSLSSVVVGEFYTFPLTYAMKVIGGSVSLAELKGDQGYIDVSLCPGDLDDVNQFESMEETEINAQVIQAITQKDIFTGKSTVYERFFWFNLEETTSIPTKPDRLVFWENVFNNGVDSGTPICDNIYDVLLFDFYKAADGAATVMSVKFDQLDATSALPQDCVLALVAAISILPTTCGIQTRPAVETHNVRAQYLIQTRPGAQPDIPWYNSTITGTGQVAAVSDTGIDLNNCYFWDSTQKGQNFVKRRGNLDAELRKVVLYDPFVDSSDYNYGHGTHVAGTIAGHKSIDGISEQTGLADGVARDAKIAFIDIGTDTGKLILPPPDRLYSTGRPLAKVHSASWGSNYNGYGINARNMDSVMYANEDFLIVVAAGNYGKDDTFNTVGDPGTAKNVITVGSSHSTNIDLADGMLGPNYISDFSSKGPTADGRTKPDIVAPGSYILSAGARTSFDNECDPDDKNPPIAGGRQAGLLSLQGTSMAAAVVSGTALLIRQYFEEGYYPSGTKVASHSYSPTGGLVKAVLLNGGQALTGVDRGTSGQTPVVPYDNIQNFGRISLLDSLYLEGTSSVQAVLFDRETIADGQFLRFSGTYTVSDQCKSGTPFRATLVWTDPPATGGCRSCVLNDLDLHVTKNNITSFRYFPNGLTAKDSKNNAERVEITDFIDGDNFTVTVYGYNLVTPSQNFSLAITGCVGVPSEPLRMPERPTTNGTSQPDFRLYIIIGLSCLGGCGCICLCCACIAEAGRRR